MSDTIILHHDDPSHAAAVARGEAVTNPADLLPGDVLLSRWAPGRYITVTAPARHFCGYLAVEYQTEDGKCGTLNVRADVNPFARRPMFAAAPEQAGLVQVHGQACACQLCERPDLEELEARATARTPWPKTPTMTRAHFAYVARILAAARSEGVAVDRLAGIFAYHLADTNPRFDSDRFITAAIGAL